MSGDNLFGGMHDKVISRATPHADDVKWVCLIELVENGPFLATQVPEEDPEGFDQSGMNVLLSQGHATRISVKGRTGFVAATEKGMDAYLSRFKSERFEDAKRNRIATFNRSA